MDEYHELVRRLGDADKKTSDAEFDSRTAM
jgi:hypothetical protein